MLKSIQGPSERLVAFKPTEPMKEFYSPRLHLQPRLWGYFLPPSLQLLEPRVRQATRDPSNAQGGLSSIEV